MLSKEKITREWFREHREECLLAVSFVGILLLFFIRFGVFASDVDWLNQHSVFPEYFRKLFYKTGKLIPSFASNIGGGQNIYNFSYYGFLSPLILPSYLLPFVGMEQYLMAISILCVLASVILLYHWMRSRGFDGKISAFLAMIYLLASPVLYQSYTQWMFINYMPFLILAFIGVDRYMEKKKPCILVVAVFLMIMTSYYFSIAGILALGIYQIASYLRNEEEFHFWKWFRKEFCFGCYILISVCMSAVFLVPTALTLMGRSKESSIKYSLLELLLPRIDWAEFTYSGYGIGLTTLLVTVLIISLFYKKAWERMLSYSLAVILFVPVFELLLNGGLYLRSKVFIPFLPLLLYWMGYFLKQLKKEAVKEKIVLFCFAFTVLLVVIFGMRIPQFPLLLADSIVMLLAYIGYRKYQRLLILMFPVLLFLAGFSVGFHGTQKNMVSQEQMQTVQNAEVSGLIEELMKSDSRGYRMEVHGSDELNAVNINRIYNIHQNISSVYSSTYEMEYDIFRRSVFEVNDAHRNILMQGFTNNTAFLKFMGIKYIITTEPVPNQIPVKKSEHYYVYNVGTVAPVGYATDRVMSSDLYGEFTYPYNQIAVNLYYSLSLNLGT